MSIALMTIAFKASLPTAQKFVLVALCDSANDQGECYPSVPTLADKCSMSARTVQAALAGLESAGFVRREFRKGRSTVYWLDPRNNCTPATTAPPQMLHPTPANAAPPPPQMLHPTPANAAPITVNEPSEEPSGKRKRNKPALETVSVVVLVLAGFEESAAEDFIAHKAAHKAPLTERAWADHLREAEKAGWSPADAAEKVMAKGWKGFEAKYVANDQPRGRGGGESRQAALEARNKAVAKDYMRDTNEPH